MHTQAHLATSETLLTLAASGQTLVLAQKLEQWARLAEDQERQHLSLLLAAAWTLSAPQVPDQQKTLRRLASRLQGVSPSLSAQLLLSLQDQWLVHLPLSVQQKVEAGRIPGGRPLPRPFSLLTCYQSQTFSEDSLEVMEKCLCQQYGEMEAFRRVESVLVRAKAWKALARAALRWMQYTSDREMFEELWKLAVQCAGVLAPDGSLMGKILKARQSPWSAHEAAWIAHLLRQQQWSHLTHVLPAFVSPSEDLVLRVHFASLASQDELGSTVPTGPQVKPTTHTEIATLDSNFVDAEDDEHVGGLDEPLRISSAMLQRPSLPLSGSYHPYPRHQVSNGADGEAVQPGMSIEHIRARLFALDAFVEEEQACLFASSMTQKGGIEVEAVWEGLLKRRLRSSHVWESLFHAVAEGEAWPLLEKLLRHFPQSRIPMSNNPASFSRLLETYRQGQLKNVEMLDWLWQDFSKASTDIVRFERLLAALREKGDLRRSLRAWRLFGLSQRSAVLRAFVWTRMAAWFEETPRIPWRGLTMAWMAWAWFPKDPLVLRAIWRRVRLFGLSHPLGRWCEEMALQGGGDVTWQIQVVRKLLLEKDGAQRAWRVLQKMLQRAARHPEMLQLGRQLALSLGLSRQALDFSYRLLAKADAPLSRARHLLGLGSMLEDDKQKQPEALEAYRKAHALVPKETEVLWPMVDLLLRMGDESEAIALMWLLFERIRDVETQRALLVRLAHIAIQLPDGLDDALRACQHLFSLEGGFEDALFLVPSLLVRGAPARLAEILSQAQVYASTEQESMELVYWQAELGFRLKDHGRASEALQRIEAHPYPVPQTILARAASLAACFQAWSRLEGLLKKRITQYEDDPLEADRLPALYLQLGCFYEYTLQQPQQALSAYRLALTLSPTSTFVLERAEALCAQVGLFSEQVAYLIRLLPLASDRKELARLFIRLACAEAHNERWGAVLHALYQATQADVELVSVQALITALEDLLGPLDLLEASDMAKRISQHEGAKAPYNALFPEATEPPPRLSPIPMSDKTPSPRSTNTAIRRPNFSAPPSEATEEMEAFSDRSLAEHASQTGQHSQTHTDLPELRDHTAQIEDFGKTDVFVALPDPLREAMKEANKTNTHRSLPDPSLVGGERSSMTQDDLDSSNGRGVGWVPPESLVPQQELQAGAIVGSGELDDPDMLPPLLSSDEHLIVSGRGKYESSGSLASYDALLSSQEPPLPPGAEVSLEQIFSLAERLHGGDDEQQNSAAEQIFQLVERLRQVIAKKGPKEQPVAAIYNIAQLFQHTLQQAPMALLTYHLGLQLCPGEDLFILRCRELAPTWQRETQLLTELYLDVPSSTQPLHRLLWLCKQHGESDLMALSSVLLRYYGEDYLGELPYIEESVWNEEKPALSEEELRRCVGDFVDQAEAASSLFLQLAEHEDEWKGLLPPLATHLAVEPLEPNHELSRLARRLSLQFGLPAVSLVLGESDTLAPALVRYEPPTFLLGDAFVYESTPEIQRFLLAKTMTQLLPPFRAATLLGPLGHLLLQYLPREIFPPAEIPIELWTLAERFCLPEVRQDLPAPVVWNDTVERISSQIGLLTTPSFSPALHSMSLYAAGRLDRPLTDFPMLIENFPPLHMFLSFAFSRQHLILRKKLEIPLNPGG
ncbi:MAG: hypothetical protein H6728_15705 [Myxococcales bacterium]|nr:hypothetical protein [Myxococcales bacterium]MCB9644518.1 hypothetical protein [Myxococcales bacterium]